MSFTFINSILYKQHQINDQFHRVVNQLCGIDKFSSVVQQDEHDPNIYTLFADIRCQKNHDTLFASGFLEYEAKNNLLRKILLDQSVRYEMKKNAEQDIERFGIDQFVIDDHPVRCLKRSMINMVANDAICGNWHTHIQPKRILFDYRVRKVEKIIQKYTHAMSLEPSFFWLKSVGTPVLVVACVFLKEKTYPKFVCGVAGSLQLNEAIYLSYLNAVENYQRTKYYMFCDYAGEDPISVPDHFMKYANDIDLGQARKFDFGQTILAGALPEDHNGSDKAHVGLLRQAFKKQDIKVKSEVLTSPDVAQHGYIVMRSTSPALLTQRSVEGQMNVPSRIGLYGDLVKRRCRPPFGTFQ